MGGAVSAGEDNEELVDNLVEADYVKTPSIEKALRAVDRGNYYLEGYRDTAYKDLAWKNGNLHLSAPCIYSEVLECLKLLPGQSFLNLGSGTGYLSTVAGLLLGTYGINHGVEQHVDVVEYANTRLSEFILGSSALDIMDFCRPSFVVGNCLQLDPSCSVQSYDRVYCGAAVPPEYLAYIRNLVKVGGVVVMPSGDQLLQIQRVKEDAWETKNVLPVSFATLVEPTNEERANGAPVTLPDRVPLKLQEICRSTVRSVLRANIHEEHPDFKMRSVLHTKKRRSSGGGGHRLNSGSSDGDGDGGVSRRRRRFIRRILIPVFHADSDEEDLDLSPPRQNQERQDEDEDEDENGIGGGGAQNENTDGASSTVVASRRRVRRPIIAIGTAGVSRRAGGRLHMEDLRWNRFYVHGNARRAVAADEENAGREEENPNVVGHNDHSNNNRSAIDHMPIEEEEDIRDGLDSEQRLLLSGATRTDGHGHSDNEEEMYDEIVHHQSTDQMTTEPNDVPPLTDGSESDDEEERKVETTLRSNVGSSTGGGTVSTSGGGGGGESSKRSHSESEVPEREARRKRAAAANATVVSPPPFCHPWRGLHTSDDNDSDQSDEESETYKEQQRRLRHDNVNMQKNFTQAMTSRILLLPVPDSVKAYLNYYRK